jgi:hypothetical protein
MGRKSSGRLARLALGVMCLVPNAAFAWSPGGPAPDPAGPAPYYSPWVYWTPILYRWCAEWHLRRAGGPDSYPAGPWSYLIIKDPVYIFDPNNVPRGGTQSPPAQQPPAGEQ